MSLERRNAGKGHSYKIDGEKVPGVTTLIGDGLAKPALVNWAANTTAGYAIDHWDSLSTMTPSARLEKLKKARYEDLDQAARRGTEVHDLAEKLTHGEEVDVPDPIAGHVESAVRFLDEWKPKAILTEAVVGSRKWRYCGTTDAVYKLPDGRVVISDFKTSRSGIFGEVALQLSAYANAEVYLHSDGTEHPVSELAITGAIAVWIRADGYDVYPIDISERVFQTFLYVATVGRRSKVLRDLVGEALDVPSWTEAVA